MVDLVPLTANARKSIEAAIADFRKSVDGVRVDAAVTDLRLVGVEFDAKTLRVIAEADGTVQVAVTKHGRRAIAASVTLDIHHPTHMHHQCHAEQRRREVDDRDGHEGGDHMPATKTVP